MISTINQVDEGNPKKVWPHIRKNRHQIVATVNASVWIPGCDKDWVPEAVRLPVVVPAATSAHMIR